MKNEDVIQLALEWWNELPMQNIYDCRNGWANLVMIYYPEKTDCQDITNDEILYIWQHEHKSEMRKLKIQKIHPDIVK
jgi:hypothetical protein